MIQSQISVAEQAFQRQDGFRIGRLVLWMLMALSSLTMLAPLEAVAQNNKNKPRKSAAKSQEKEPDAKPAESEKVADDNSPKFTAEQIEKAKSKYNSAEEAYAVGLAHHNSRNFAASREPLESALILASEKDVEFRIRVCQALLSAYRQVESSDPFVEASEYIIQRSEREAEQSLTRSALLSFIRERGKVEPFIQRHEERLKENPKDRLSVYLLSEVYLDLRPNPKRCVELLDQLAALDQKKPGGVANIHSSAKLAMQYVKAKEYQKGAELYEQLATQDKNMEAWHWKEAAAAWLRLKDNEKALAAAKKAEKAAPEKRSELLTHFFHRNLGDTFLALGEPKRAIPHFEKAIENTQIEGYIKDCKASLAEAREKAKNKK